MHITANATNPLHIDIPPKFVFVFYVWLSPDMIVTHFGENETVFLKFFAKFLKVVFDAHGCRCHRSAKAGFSPIPGEYNMDRMHFPLPQRSFS
jgi:hypothetical protein